MASRYDGVPKVFTSAAALAVFVNYWLWVLTLVILNHPELFKRASSVNIIAFGAKFSCNTIFDQPINKTMI